MLEVLDRGVSNASSVHLDGQAARRLIEESRSKIARALDARSKEIVFTSSATEANNLAIYGVTAHLPAGQAHIIARTSVEHPSVLGPMDWMQNRGIADVRSIQVTKSGQIDWPDFERILEQAPALISVVAANNETGVCQPIVDIARHARARGCVVHIDATQWVGRLPFSVTEIEADLVTFSSHKVGGPLGAGALWIRRGTLLEAMLRGGHQERNRRAGTENTAAIAGFGAAITAAVETLDSERIRQTALREKLWTGLKLASASSKCYGLEAERLPNTVCASIGPIDGETVLMGLDLAGISVSSGSACTAGSRDPSHVLIAMGVEEEEARGAVRFSLGYNTEEAEIEKTMHAVASLIDQHDELEE